MQWLLALYPILVHVAVVAHSRSLQWAAIVLLGLNILYPGLVRAALWPWLGFAGVVAGSAWFVALGQGRYFLYAAPVLIPLALLWLFARTLLPDRVPLVTRMAAAMRGPLPPRVTVYTRQVTVFWVLVLATLALANLLLALFARPLLWSLFTNFIDYVLLGIVFVLEWLFRRRYLGSDEAMTWRQYLRGLIRLDTRRP